METRPSPDNPADHTDTETIRAAVDTPPEPQRAVARLCMIEGWQNQRVAVLVGRVKHYRRQANGMLRAALRDLRQEGKGLRRVSLLSRPEWKINTTVDRKGRAMGYTSRR